MNASLAARVRRGDPVSVRLAGSAVGAALLELVLAVSWLWTRPPCLPGYVRLLDLGVPLAFGGGVIALVPAVAFLVGARRVDRAGSAQLLRAGSVFCLAFALLLAGLLVNELLTVNTQPYDYGCWTF